MQRPVDDIAGTRMNRAVELAQLQRFDEAKSELEDCLKLLQNDPARTARVLSSLADLFDKEGDLAQAINQERRALALSEQLPAPADRAISHGRLAIYSHRDGSSSAVTEAQPHQLASLIYRLVAGLGQGLQTSPRNCMIHFLRARDDGGRLEVPSVTEVLSDSSFDALDKWLQQRHVNLKTLQAEVDELLEQVGEAALGKRVDPQESQRISRKTDGAGHLP